MKREIKVPIDANTKTCGKCPFQSCRNCYAFFSPGRDPVRLSIEYKSNRPLRCKQCLDNECVEKGKP